MRTGYGATILEIDLSQSETRRRYFSEDLTKSFIGGAGLATRILWDETTADTEPFSPENPLIFMVGPLTGTAVPSSSRYIVAGISPLTNILGQAHSGGAWADELRHSGLEGLVIRGKAAKPVYLWIHDGDAEIRDASHVWGRDTCDIEEILRRETDVRASVAAIGIAGERLVRMACIINDGRKARAAARCGLGALMGSKQLKAIVVRGTLTPPVLNKDRLKEAVARIYALNPPAPKDDHELLAYRVENFKRYIKDGGVPIKNWQKGLFDAGYRIPEDMRNSVQAFCRRCPYGCSDSRLTERGERHMVYEHWGPMGLNCLVDNIDALQESYYLCNKYGLDSISVGAAIAFAMECFEKGLITTQQTEGLDLSWGNHRAMLELVKQIGERRGLGELLGEGVRRAAEHIGGLAPEYAIHAKGLELPAFDPRAATSMAVQYATGTIGGTHVESPVSQWIEAYLSDHIYTKDPARIIRLIEDFGYSQRIDRFAIEGKGEMVAKTQNFGSMINSLGVCLMLFLRIPPSQFVELLNHVTGWNLDFDEFMKTGERIFNLRRMFNVRRGISRKDDILPPRILTHKRGEGGAADNLPHLGAMLSEYYGYRGWSEEGIPTREKLAELCLHECL
ncbi:MAG: aldehyde ferredoxin oxidoreductase [Chloroflexota bacterium]|nr:MAG: aldehyde ferredoxin oxidoreductase [Chloroflexota bacterium]